MSSCQFFEVEISAMIDGELPPPAVVRTVDHILRCDRCRDFYRSAREVEGLLVSAGAGASSETLPGALWTRIEGAASEPDEQRSRRRPEPVPAWARRVAALAVLAVGAAVIAGLVLLPRPAGDGSMVIELEGRPGAMTDARFVAIATELLQADRQYHLKMQEIMAAVNRHTFVPEGSLDPRAQVDAPESELLRASSEPTGESGSPARTWY